MAEMVNAAGSGTLAYGRYRVFVRNLLYYTGRPHVDLSSDEQVQTFLESTTPVLCVLRQADFEHALQQGASAHELGRVSYLNTGNLTLGTLLRPDPATHLQTVVLVSNRPAP